MNVQLKIYQWKRITKIKVYWNTYLREVLLYDPGKISRLKRHVMYLLMKRENSRKDTYLKTDLAVYVAFLNIWELHESCLPFGRTLRAFDNRRQWSPLFVDSAKRPPPLSCWRRPCLILHPPPFALATRALTPAQRQSHFLNKRWCIKSYLANGA